MFSNKNKQMIMLKTRPTKQRFGLRKLSIGVASVLLGITWTSVGVAKADTNSDQSTVTTTETIENTSTASINNNQSAGSVAISEAQSATSSSNDIVNQPTADAEPVLTPMTPDSAASDEQQPAASTVTEQPNQTVQPVKSGQPSTPVNANSAQSNIGTIDSIYDDKFLKDKYGIDINHLDAKSVLLLASLFHIFANEANLGADVNGNIAVGILGGSIDFGTRGDSIHLSSGGIHYIQQLKDALNSGSFRNPTFNHVIFGNDINAEIKDGKVYVNGQLMNNLKPEEVFKDGNVQYIDFAKVFTRLISASNFYSNQETSEGVKWDFSDMNNQYVDVSQREAN